MSISKKSFLGRVATTLLAGLASSAGWAIEGGEAISLRSQDSFAAAPASAADESWDVAPAKIHEVGNWLTMSEAQAGLPQGFYAGAELFFARATTNTPGVYAVGRGFTTGTEIDVAVQNFTFDFQASPRIYAGWRSPDTGSAVQFTYWNYDNTANRGITLTDQTQAFIVINGIDNAGDLPFFSPGDTISTQAFVRFNVYDIEYFKSLAFAGGRWLVTGSAGARIADASQGVNTSVNGIDINSNNPIAYRSSKSVGFTGAGPRLTLEGRRNLGPFASLYARGGYSLLVGTVQGNVYQEDLLQGYNLHAATNSTGTVTVADIEIGASWQVSSFLLVSAGYQFQSWQGLERNIGQNIAISGSDFITFDGLVARAIFTY